MLPLFMLWLQISGIVGHCDLRDNWPVIKRTLFVPELDEIAHVLGDKLNQHFESVDAQIVNCPDLRQPPYSMANLGMTGNTRLLDIGHLTNIVPLINRSKSYKLTDLINLAQLNRAFVFGGGAGPFRQIGSNTEGIFNFNYRSCTLDQHSIIAQVDDSSPRGFVVRKLNNTYTDLAVGGTLFASTGLPGNVVRILLRKRINETFEITHGLRDILAQHFGPAKTVGLGVIIVVRRGACRIQVMPDFSTTPVLGGTEGFFRWVNYYNMSAPLVLLGTIVTNNMGLLLYSPHFHVKSDHGEAGHWHYDLEPDIVEYEVLINTGEYLFRIDFPRNQ